MAFPRVARLLAAHGLVLFFATALHCQTVVKVHLSVYVGAGILHPLNGREIMVDSGNQGPINLGRTNGAGYRESILPRPVVHEGVVRFRIDGFFVFNPCENGSDGKSFIPSRADEPLELHVEPDRQWYEEDAACASKVEFRLLASMGRSNRDRGANEFPPTSEVPAAYGLPGGWRLRKVAYAGGGFEATANQALEQIAARLHCDVGTVRAGIDQYEDQAESPYDRGVAATLKENYQAAVRWFEQARQVDKDDDGLVEDDVGLARAYWKMDKPAEAEGFVWDALAIYPYDPDLLDDLSEILWSRGQKPAAAAVDALTDAILRNMDEEDGEKVGMASRKLGLVLDTAGDSQHALDLLEGALKWDSHAFGSGDPYVASDSIDLGLYFSRHEDYARAEKEYGRAAEILKCAPDAETLGRQPLKCSIVLNDIGDLLNRRTDYLDGARYGSYAIQLLKEHGKAVASSPVLNEEMNTLRQACSGLNEMELSDKQQQDRDRYCGLLNR
jgi:tetratricopeptide (TPR) repeat protein